MPWSVLRTVAIDGKRVQTAPGRRTDAEIGRERKYLTPAEIEKLLATAKKRGRYGQRDALAILMCYRHGLRVSELVALRWSQVDWATHRQKEPGLAGALWRFGCADGEKTALGVERRQNSASHPGRPLQKVWREPRESVLELGSSVSQAICIDVSVFTTRTSRSAHRTISEVVLVIAG